MAERRKNRRRYDDFAGPARIRQLEDELAELAADLEEAVSERPTRIELQRDYLPRAEQRELARLFIDRAGLAFVAMQSLIGLGTLAAVLLGR